MRNKITRQQFENVLNALFPLGYSGRIDNWETDWFTGWLSVGGAGFSHCVLSVNIDGGGSNIIFWVVYNDEDEWSNEEVGGYIKGVVKQIVPEMKCNKSLTHDTSLLDLSFPEESNIEPIFDVGDVLITSSQIRLGINEGLPIVCSVDKENSQYICNGIKIPFSEQGKFARHHRVGD